MRRALVLFRHAPSLDRPDLRPGTPGRSRTHPLGFGDRAVLLELRAYLENTMVELDGYAPSPPHCECGMLLLALQPHRENMDARAGLAPAWDSFADCRMAALPTRATKKENRGSGHSSSEDFSDVRPQ